MHKLSNRALSKIVWQDPACFLAFGFGSGLMPYVPGTWGTIAAIPIYLLLSSCSLFIYLSATFAAFILGVYVCNEASKKLGVHDFGGIVWDEIVGFLLTMVLAPPGWIWILIGFLLFRLFDIWKPYPIGLMDKHIKGGVGIMLDDMLAAVYAWVILQGIVWCVK